MTLYCYHRKENPAPGGIVFFPSEGGNLKTNALFCGLALLRDLLHCLLCSLLDCLSFLCGHGGCELGMMTYKSTRLRVK